MFSRLMQIGCVSDEKKIMFFSAEVKNDKER